MHAVRTTPRPALSEPEKRRLVDDARYFLQHELAVAVDEMVDVRYVVGAWEHREQVALQVFLGRHRDNAVKRQIRVPWHAIDDEAKMLAFAKRSARNLVRHLLEREPDPYHITVHITAGVA